MPYFLSPQACDVTSSESVSILYSKMSSRTLHVLLWGKESVTDHPDRWQLTHSSQMSAIPVVIYGAYEK